MRLWRICRSHHAVDSLSGLGGLYASGRWHRRGRPIIYTSSTASLSALEVLVHVEPAATPPDLALVEIEVPDSASIETVELDMLQADWRRYPAPPALAEFGSTWLEQRRSLVLSVPSAVVPNEFNHLLNPGHPEAGSLRVIGVSDFSFDLRLLR